jgi:hypothetical protein
MVPMTETRTAQVIATHHDNAPASVIFLLETETLEQAQELAAQFPKACKVRACAVTGTRGRWGMADVRISLRSNGVNKGINETGQRRYRAVRRACEKLGITLDYVAPYGNCYATLAEFEAAAGM